MAPTTKRKFTEQEDLQLAHAVMELGGVQWEEIAQRIPTRSARQCRERWKNYLSPSVSNASWTEAEDIMLMAMYRQLGSKWSIMAKYFPKRTDVALKNRYAALMKLRGEMKLVTAPVAEKDNRLADQTDQMETLKTETSFFDGFDDCMMWSPM